MINHFTVVESIYGKIIVNRNCDFQIDALAKTGRTHIESELQNIFQFVDKLTPGAIIIDAGANIGLFSIPVAQRRKDVSIIAFEPQRIIYNALCGSIALNDLSNVYVHNAAISDCAQYLVLPIIDYSMKMDYGTVQVQPGEIQENTFMRNSMVRGITIDAMDLPRCDFIKIDVEGFEIQAIKGAKNTIKTFKPILWVEHHIVGVQAIAEAVGEGYQFIVADPLNMVCVPI